jgi:hypothetical protein
MSKVAIKGADTGTGVFTLESPATNTDRTLVLPDEAGTIDTLQRAGNVLQVVQVVYDNQFSTTSTSFVDTGLTASITPTSASSKILVLVTQQGFTGGGDDNIRFNIVRNSTQIAVSRAQTRTGTQVPIGNYLHKLDTPATTSSVTYKTQVRNELGNTIYFQWGTGESSATMTLMEIAG